MRAIWTVLYDPIPKYQINRLHERCFRIICNGKQSLFIELLEKTTLSLFDMTNFRFLTIEMFRITKEYQEVRNVSFSENLANVLNVWSLTFTLAIEAFFNPFFPNASFLYPLKPLENRKVFWCFQVVEKGCIGNEWVKERELFPQHSMVLLLHEFFEFWFTTGFQKIFPSSIMLPVFFSSLCMSGIWANLKKIVCFCSAGG